VFICVTALPAVEAKIQARAVWKFGGDVPLQNETGRGVGPVKTNDSTGGGRKLQSNKVELGVFSKYLLLGKTNETSV
jgi:hypothetical protein